MSVRQSGLVLLITASILPLARPALAKPPHKQSLERYYAADLPAKLRSCAACHVVEPGKTEKQLAEEAPPHNAFGKRLAELGESLEKAGKPLDIATRLELVADEDADGDGLANEAELLAGCSPGDAADKPADDATAKALEAHAAFKARYKWRPLRSVVGPAMPQIAGATHPIDAFLEEQRAARKLAARPAASKPALLRRVYFDLIGLPPPPHQLQAFVANDSPEAFEKAYERIVEQLLASPEYGERWGRHWMDIWRYSDWAGWGNQVRDSQPHIWRWRDWIVESLNADLPYDQMVRLMLAADELQSEDAGALRATGFLARNFKLLSREQWMQDTVEHTAQAFLGVTLKCARCHDHMYDPLSQRDYYQFRAIFEPHKVRLDYVPGEADPSKDGLPRVYDAELGAATFLFERGDERRPVKDKPLSPGVPSAIAGPSYAVQPINLPPLAVTPQKQMFVTESTLVAAEKLRAEERAKNEQSRDRAYLAGGALAAAGVVLFEEQWSESKLVALKATLAAEQSENASDAKSNPARFDELAQAAAAAQRAEAVCMARRDLHAATSALRAEQQKLDKLQANEKPDTNAVKAATAAVEAAQKKFTEIEQRARMLAAQQAQPPTTDFKRRTLTTYPATSTGRRAALAAWLISPENALTARVAVNHIWARHFGRGLAPTVADFGVGGQPPSHPALLDFLAAEFMVPQRRLPGEGATAVAPWSMKHLHRLIVTSAAYRQASAFDRQMAAVDPDNVYLWRFAPRLLEAEVVRDSLLAVSGRLDFKRGGPELDHTQGLTTTRRSLYYRHAAEKQMEFLKLFDAAGVDECYRRKGSVVPQQALALANSELALSSAKALAEKLKQESGDDQAKFIGTAFETILSRTPTEDERTACREFLTQQAGPRAAENLVHALFNHYEFTTQK